MGIEQANDGTPGRNVPRWDADALAPAGGSVVVCGAVVDGVIDGVSDGGSGGANDGGSGADYNICRER